MAYQEGSILVADKYMRIIGQTVPGGDHNPNWVEPVVLTDPNDPTQLQTVAAGAANVSLGQLLDPNNSPAPLTTSSFPTRSLSVTTTSGSTSVIGTFTAADVGGSIVAAGIPGSAVIVSQTGSAAVFRTPGTPQAPNGQAASASGTVSATIRQGFLGTFTVTRAAGYVRQELVLGTDAVNKLGGLLAFYGSEDGVNATLSVVKRISDMRFVKQQDLLNVWGYFRCSFVPDRALVSGENVFLSVTHRRQDDGPFAVQLTDQQERQNLLLRPEQSYLAGFLMNGRSLDVGVSNDRALRTYASNMYQSPSGSNWMEPLRDDIRYDFGTEQGQFDYLRLRNLSTGTGSYAPDTVNGGLVCTTGATPGSVLCALSSESIAYSQSPGHGLMGEATNFLSVLPTGDAFAEWGLFSNDRKDWIGYGADAGGAYVGMRKNTNPGDFANYTSKVYQTAWNRDPCLGDEGSLFTRTVDGIPVADVMSLLKDNFFRISTELLYAKGQRFEMGPPSERPPVTTVHVNEYANTSAFTSLRSGTLFLGVYLSNGTSGQTLSCTMGSWHGGTFTNEPSDFTKALNRIVGNNDEMRLDVEPDTALVRTVTDGVTDGTTTLTSATAAFTQSDVGAAITGGSIPSNTFIQSVTNATTVIMTNAATATATGVSVTITYPFNVIGFATDGSPTSQPVWKAVGIYMSKSRNPARMRFRKNLVWDTRLQGWT